MAECKYYKLVRQVSYDSGVTWISLDEFKKGDLYETDSPDCGGGITQYRWVNVSGEYTCVGTTKYQKTKKQQSTDGGQTWRDVNPPEYSTGAVIERDSSDCQPTPEPQYRWVNIPLSQDYECVGTTKYYKQKEQVSLDGGTTWTDVVPTQTRRGGIGEIESTDCGYVPSTGYSRQYLTFVARDSGKFGFNYDSTSGTLYYSLDSGGTWNIAEDGLPTQTVQKGQKIMWKGNLVPSSYGIGTFYNAGNNYFDVEGNIMSLLYGDNFIGQTSLSGKDHAFDSLFTMSNEGVTLVNAKNLVLPATTLSVGCYNSMFWDCYDLISPPQLPAMIMVEDCYNHMFANCTSMISTPKLPSTTLATRCYYQMFLNCESLVNLSNLNLPATTLVDQCYEQMFWGCSSLTTAPVLPAPTLVYRCYCQMFWNCCQLNYVKCLATSGINTNASTLSWLGSNSDVCTMSSSGTFVKASSASWPRGKDGIPSGWEVQNA